MIAKWNGKWLLFWNLLAAFGFVTLFSPWTHSLWRSLDITFFTALNSSLEGNPRWQLFWALANHKWADWVEDVCFLLFFLFYIRSGKDRLRRACQLFVCILYMALVIYLINRVLFRENLQISSPSPTRILPSCFRLSDHITWLHVKDVANKSFPGDHGTTAILFAASLTFLARRKMLSLLACLYAVFLCIPRLITGAHWLSDVVVGSGGIAMVTLSWLFCSPLFASCVNKLHRLLDRK